MAERKDQDQSGGAFEVRFPGGGISGRGWVAIVALLVAASIGAFAALVYVNYLGFARLDVAQAAGRTGLEELRDIASRDHALRAIEHERIVDGIAAIVYVLLLPEQDQQRLLKHMGVPRLVREMEQQK